MIRSNRSKIVFIALLFVVIFSLFTFGNYQFSRTNPGGSDFLVHWVGTRELVLNGASPYSDEVALKIQTAAYGRPARSNEHELRVAYPLYSIILFLPFSLIADFIFARAIWMTVLEFGLFALVFVLLRVTNWKPKRMTLIFLLLFVVFWYHGMRPLINGNAVIIVTLLLSAGLLALRNGEQELAGVLFAFSTIKPQVVVIPLAFLFFWSLYRKKYRLIGWMIGTVALLSAAASLIIPDWIIQNLREVLRYPLYNPPGTLQDCLKVWFPGAGGRLGLAVTVGLSLLLLVEWWHNRKGDFQAFLWLFSLTLVCSVWIGIQTDPGNFIVLLPAMFFIFSFWEDRWKKKGVLLTLGVLLLITVSIWVIFITSLEVTYQPIQSPIMFLPLPALLFPLLYWIRWWCVKPPTVWYEQVYKIENP